MRARRETDSGSSTPRSLTGGTASANSSPRRYSSYEAPAARGRCSEDGRWREGVPRAHDPLRASDPGAHGALCTQDCGCTGLCVWQACAAGLALG